MATLYPNIEPYDQGMLDVGDNNSIYWEMCGNPDGKAALVLHGGPGSGCGPAWRRFFDPSAYRVVLFDQRGCGRSIPHAGDPSTDLTKNTTHYLLTDIEALRKFLGIGKWLLFGGSWGSTLALAYAEKNPERVSQLILFSVVTTTRREVEWVTRHAGRFFPEAWARFRDGVPAAKSLGNLAEAYSELLEGPDPAVREKAAKDWCAWEDAHVAVHAEHNPDPRFADARFRMAFARLVTHYWRHAAWLKEGELVAGVKTLADTPVVLAHGRLDLSSPPDIAYELAARWPRSELILIDHVGHGSADTRMAEILVEATDRFKLRR